MGEVLGTFFVGFVEANSGAGCGILEGEFALDHSALDFAEGLGFAELGLVELGVELGHEQAGGGVVDFPERGEY